MEPASTVYEVSYPKNLRPKQIEVIEAFGSATQVVAKLPTGYGKTMAAAGAYAQLRARGVVNRVLYIVPRRNQANQAAHELPTALSAFNVTTKALVVGDNPIQAERAHRESKLEVFVATVQSLLSSATQATVCRLTESGRWFVVVDEHHHYGDDGQWADCIKRLPSAALLAMSATPNRHDGTDFFPDPSIVETYYAASKQGFVKKLSLHAYEYSVDAVTVDGRVVPFTTADIVEQSGSDSPDDIDRFMAARKMRWSPKYISPLVTFPLDRIIHLRTANIRSQMLIQAMSCSHARMVCEQVKALIPEYMSVDWVGTGPSGRTSQENEEVLEKFCPPKDRITGIRPWTLDVLVNVGMAGEGLDTTDVTEVVFLTPANLTISNYQTIGRGARAMLCVGEIKPPCHVNVDTASPMAEYVGQKVMELFDEDVVIEDEIPAGSGSGSADEYSELPDRMQVVIVDVRLTDIKQEPMYRAIRDDVVSKTHQMPGFTEAVVEDLVEKGIQDYLARGNNQSSIIAQKQQMVNAAVGKIAGLVIRRVMEASGIRPEKTFVGDVKKRINQKKKTLFGSVEDASDETLDRQYQWLRELEKQILLGHALQGAPKWLL